MAASVAAANADSGRSHSSALHAAGRRRVVGHFSRGFAITDHLRQARAAQIEGRRRLARAAGAKPKRGSMDADGGRDRAECGA